MVSEWSTIPLGALSIRITKGTTPSTLGHPFVDRGINFIKSESITDDGDIDRSKFAFIDAETHKSLARSILAEGDVLFSMAGVYLGKTAVVSPSVLPANTNQAVGIIRLDKSRADSHFVHYSLKAPTVQDFILRSGGQSAQPNFNLQQIGSLPIPSLPLREQESISSILRSLDDRIQLLRLSSDSLEAIARAIFRSWFVDFDPVRAKAEGREPEGMNADTAAFFPCDLVQQGDSIIPAGWTGAVLGDVCEAARVGVQKSEMCPDENYVGLEHIPRESWSLPSWGTAKDLQSGKSRFYQGEILFGKLRPYFHKVSIAPVDGICSTDILVLKPKQSGWMAFVLSHLSSKPLIDYATRLSNGAKMPRTSWHDLSVYDIVLPPESLAESFNNIVEPIVKKVIANVHAAATLRELRDTLLPRLISGKLRVPEAEKLVEAVL
jgi:type I restriction enzyme S subunit